MIFSLSCPLQLEGATEVMAIQEKQDTLTERLTEIVQGDNVVEKLTQFFRFEIDAAYQENMTVSISESRATNCSWDRSCLYGPTMLSQDTDIKNLLCSI
jgi:hypothetical protein